jgi:hypothetical protein
MEYIQDCWQGCGEEFVVHAPDRQDPQLTEGVPAQCNHCGQKYTFTVDGDGEPSLDPIDDESLGQNIEDPDATHF